MIRKLFAWVTWEASHEHLGKIITYTYGKGLGKDKTKGHA